MKRRVSRSRFPKYLRFLTNSICPDTQAGYCQLSLDMWQLMCRIWRDYLGLAPSESMIFNDQLFAAAGGNMDHYLALAARGYPAGILLGEHFQGDPLDGNELHLNVVHALIRCLLGETCSETITNAYQRHRENLFYQFLMHKFVNPNLHPLDEIRDSLLHLAPAVLENVDANGNVSFVGPLGNQWVWERGNSTEIMKDSMGWDLIFLANLLRREFKFDLDAYKQNVLPNLLRDRVQALNAALTQLGTSFGGFEQKERELNDFLGQSAALVQDADVTFGELDSLRASIVQKLGEVSSLDLSKLSSDYNAARIAYDRLLGLQRDSRIKFQDAERLDEHAGIWSQTLAPYADTPGLLNRVQANLGDRSLAARLSALLSAIPLRIEWEKLRGTNQSLRAVADQILADLKSVAKDQEYGSIQGELVGRGAAL